MEYDGWCGEYKVTTFPWVDGRHIYFNVRYFAPGQSLERPPVSDKTVYVVDDENGQKLISSFMHSFANYVSNMSVKDDTKVIISAVGVPWCASEINYK